MAEQHKQHLIERAAERLLQPATGPSASAPDWWNGQEPTAPAHDAAFASSTAQADASPLPALTLSAAVLAKAGLIVTESGRTRAAEELRIVQQQVLRAAFASPQSGRRDTNLLMVTSARPQEGKSFTALNLAASLARDAEQSVTLIDADPKPGCLSDALGAGRLPGLVDLVLDPVREFAPLLLGTIFPRLTFLPIGLNRQASAEALASRQMARLLTGLSSRFPDRLFILDAAPCLSTSDASALAPLVGQTVFVVEAERTQRTEVEAALDLIEPCRAITLLLNKLRTSTRHTFGAYAYAYSTNRPIS